MPVLASRQMVTQMVTHKAPLHGSYCNIGLSYIECFSACSPSLSWNRKTAARAYANLWRLPIVDDVVNPNGTALLRPRRTEVPKSQYSKWEAGIKALENLFCIQPLKCKVALRPGFSSEPSSPLGVLFFKKRWGEFSRRFPSQLIRKCEGGVPDDAVEEHSSADVDVLIPPFLGDVDGERDGGRDSDDSEPEAAKYEKLFCDANNGDLMFFRSFWILPNKSVYSPAEASYPHAYRRS